MTLEKIKFQKSVLKRKQKEEEQKLHKKFVKKHSTLLLFCDILLILSLIFNIGAISITSFLVQKDNYDVAEQMVQERIEAGDLTAQVSDHIKYYETNPNMEKTLMLEESPDEIKPELKKEYFGLIILIVWWASIIFFYIIFRLGLYQPWHLYVVLFSILFISIATSFDFIFDLVLFITKVMFG